MQVHRSRNGPAVRLPATVVEAPKLKAGDHITFEVADDGRVSIARDSCRDEALEALRSLGWSLPEGFRFDRDEANARGE